jgi:hypothetical protein
MNASCLFDNKATDVAGVIDAWGAKNQTILVCRRQTKRYDEPSARIFVSGAGTGYISKDTPLPHTSYYTQDTGMGYRNEGYQLLIENVIDIDENGVIKPRNMVGVNEKRRAWCMK